MVLSAKGVEDVVSVLVVLAPVIVDVKIVEELAAIVVPVLASVDAMVVKAAEELAAIIVMVVQAAEVPVATTAHIPAQAA